MVHTTIKNHMFQVAADMCDRDQIRSPKTHQCRKCVGLTKKELVEYARILGMSTSGSKLELCQRFAPIRDNFDKRIGAGQVPKTPFRATPKVQERTAATKTKALLQKGTSTKNNDKRPAQIYGATKSYVCSTEVPKVFEAMTRQMLEHIADQVDVRYSDKTARDTLCERVSEALLRESIRMDMADAMERCAKNIDTLNAFMTGFSPERRQTVQPQFDQLVEWYGDLVKKARKPNQSVNDLRELGGLFSVICKRMTDGIRELLTTPPQRKKVKRKRGIRGLLGL